MKDLPKQALSWTLSSYSNQSFQVDCSGHLYLLHASAAFADILSIDVHTSFDVAKLYEKGCISCQHLSAKPPTQLVCQLPIEQITPDLIFNKVGVHYAGPVYIEYHHVRKPCIPA